MKPVVAAVLAALLLSACQTPAPRPSVTTASPVPAPLASARAIAASGDRSTALSAYRRLPNRSAPIVRYEYARLLEDSPDATAAERQEALAIYREVAAEGVVEAQLRLANLLHLGETVRQDRAEAQRWYDAARRIIEPAASSGDAQAQEWLGDLFREGRGVPLDGERAIFWYTQAAQTGQVSVYVKLARMFERGEAGVPVDLDEALRYYELAGAAEHAPSLFVIAKRYADGDGVLRDKVRAVELFERAAAGGDQRAFARLGDLYADESEPPANAAAAAEWYRRASRTGDEKAMFKLAELHERGRLGQPDLFAAYGWYRLAALNGHDKAPDRLARIEARLTPGERVEAVERANSLERGLAAGADPALGG